MPNLDSTAFRAWLEAQPPRKWAGIPVDGCRCPIANYLMTLPSVVSVERMEGMVQHETI